MRSFREQKTIRRILFSKPVIWFLFVFFLIIFIASSRNAIRAYWAYFERKETEREFNKMADEKISVEKRIANLNTEEGQEKEVKNVFGFHKPGEKILIILDPPNIGTSSEEKSPQNFINFLINLFR